jgi:hypothetical protein
MANKSKIGYSNREMNEDDMDSFTMLSHLDLNSEGSINFEEVLLLLTA